MKKLNSPSLVPSSMSGGNTVSDRPDLSMTAPGSVSVSPVPDVMDHLPLPEASVTLPVNPQRDRVAGNAAPGGDGPWTTAAGSDAGGWMPV